MATVGSIKCMQCQAFTNIPDEDNDDMSCSGCTIPLAYIEADQNALTINGRGICELVVEPVIERLCIYNVPNLSHIEVKSGVLNVLDMLCSRVPGGAGAEQCVVTAHTIKTLQICSNIELPNLTSMIETIKSNVPIAQSWVRCKKLWLHGKAVTAMDIPPEVEELIISQPDCPNEDEVIHHLMNVGPPHIALLRVGIETLRYSSRQVNLRVQRCAALREIIPPADDGLCDLHMYKCPLVSKLPVFACLQKMHVSAGEEWHSGMNIEIPFIPSVRHICITPFSNGLADIYHFSVRMYGVTLYDPRYENAYMTAERRRRLTRMHARVHVIERWWIDVASSPPSPAQPAGGVFYRRAMAAFMAARA